MKSKNVKSEVDNLYIKSLYRIYSSNNKTKQMKNIFCKYKNIFGKPNEGVHKQRIFGLAFWDLFLTIIASIIVAYIMKKNVFIVFFAFMIIGIFFHVLFCVDTALVKTLGLS